jgi:NB-ARC domain
MVHHFVHRQFLLTDVKRRLFDLGQRGSPTVVLQGMGGSGKTQLALECCRHADENLHFMAALWIDASSPMSVVRSYKAIASLISKNPPDDKDDKVTVSFIKNILRDWRQRWLVVFDNYDDPAAFQNQIVNDYVPTGANGSILFTSRHQDSGRLGHLIKVSTMTEDESIELLLHKSSFSVEEKAEASKIALMLGYLPLALDQAASYISSRGVYLKNFISEYHERKQVVLREIPAQWKYRKK